MPEERLLWLDVARTIAIALIVGFHLIYEFDPDQSLRIIGYTGVSIFFIAFLFSVVEWSSRAIQQMLLSKEGG